MAFIPEQFDEGDYVLLPMSNGGSSATYTKGQPLTTTSGYYVTATSGQNADVYYVCMEGKTVTTDGTLAKCVRTVKKPIFVADTTANPSRAQVGTFVDLTTNLLVDSSATTDQLFYIEDIVGPVGDKKVRGWFSGAVPNS